jgi:hypothetical protein
MSSVWVQSAKLTIGLRCCLNTVFLSKPSVLKQDICEKNTFLQTVGLSAIGA